MLMVLIGVRLVLLSSATLRCVTSSLPTWWIWMHRSPNFHSWPFTKTRAGETAGATDFF